MPRCDGPRIDQHCKHGEHQASQALRNPQESLARIAVDGAARERREQQQRDELDAARQAELHHRIGELINEPAAGQLVHPRAEIAEQLAAGNQPEIAVLEGDECAMVAESREERTHGLILAGWNQARVPVVAAGCSRRRLPSACPR